MDNESTVVVTGAAGFIGSCLAGYLNTAGYYNLILVDDFSHEGKAPNLTGKKYLKKIEREGFFAWLQKERPTIDFVYHIGARTDTTEFDYSVHEHLNVEYSKKIWRYCSENKVPLVYASSAATYGAGELGYRDSHEIIEELKPLNPYGISKNEFDKWAVRQAQVVSSQQWDKQANPYAPPAWAGLKFFNVYGPNEYHKGRMASVIFHSYNQVVEKGFVNLFRSHKKEFKDGEQLRDFIYVKDVLTICCWFLESFRKDPGSFKSGIYNVGTGVARTFNDLVVATFNAVDRQPQIKYIDIPEDIRDTYQYFTEATMEKLKSVGYTEKMFSLEEGVDDYVRNYLSQKTYY
jgi:ADP-L-glycero-D-manno-heptose 6-epimerase